MNGIENISAIAEEKLQGSELFLAEVVIKPGKKVYLFLDGDRDVTIDDCAALSRHIRASLDTEEDFELMVSSCGADQPLKMPRQYKKHLERDLTVSMDDGKKLSGTLLEVQQEGIVLRPVKPKKRKKGEPELPETVFLPFNSIETAKVNISFNK